MKRILLLVLLFFLIKNFFYCILFRPQENMEPLGIPTQQAALAIHNSNLTHNGLAFLHSNFIQQLSSIDPGDQLRQLTSRITDQLRSRAEAIDALELVPAEPMMMLDWTDAAGVTEKFFTSRFGRTLTGIDWPTIFAQLEVKEEYRTLLTSQTSVLLSLLAHPLFTETFSKRVIVTLLPDNATLFRENPLREIKDHLLLVLKKEPKQQQTALFTILTLLQSRTEILYHQGITIRAVSLPGQQQLYLASLGSNLVLSPALAPVQQSIDRFILHLVQEQTGLYVNNEYLKMKEQALGRDDFFFYTDLTQIKPVLEETVLQGGLAAELRNIPGFTGSERMVLYHSADREKEQFSSIVQFSEKELNPFQKKIYTRKAVRNRSLSNMPARLLVYFWSNWLDLAGWWQATLERGNKEEIAAAGRVGRWLEEQSGMAIDEFLAMFGNEFGFNVVEISTAGFFPVPRICFCVEIRDREKVEAMMDKIMVGMPVNRDKIAGIPVVSLMLANGMMQPSYTLLERFLVVADGRDQIEQVIHGDTARLVQDSAFQEVGRDMLQPSNLLLFARTAELVEGMKEFASWAGTVIAIRNEMAGEKSKLLVDEVILPLLDGLKMFQAKGVRSYTAPGEVMVDIVVLYAEPESDE